HQAVALRRHLPARRRRRPPEQLALVTARPRLALAAEEGFALVLALMATVVLAAAGTTAMLYVTSNFKGASRSQAGQSALALAEAGLNDAHATLYNAADPTVAGAVPTTTTSLAGGTVTYSGTLSGSTWTLR